MRNFSLELRALEISALSLMKAYHSSVELSLLLAHKHIYICDLQSAHFFC